MPELFHFSAALAAVLLLGRLLGAAFKKIGQPAVLGEVLAGIVLGPSLLGLAYPDAESWLFPSAVLPWLNACAKAGIALYMFQVGLQLDIQAAFAKGAWRGTVLASASGMLFPFLLGLGLAALLYPGHAPQGAAFPGFALFIGVAMSVTAFPVLARILQGLKLDKSRLGKMAMACAAMDDLAAWSALGLLAASLSHAGFLSLLAWLSAFFSFLLGALLRGRLAPWLPLSLAKILPWLLPAFFALSGLRTQLSLLQGWGAWGLCALIIAVASLGKVAGAGLAGFYSGLKGRDALALGILMNTRGLVELIVLNVGLELGLISPELFTMLVLMALLTTLATVPALRLFSPGIFNKK